MGTAANGKPAAASAKASAKPSAKPSAKAAPNASAKATPNASPPKMQYAYMFAKDKSPTFQLDSILRAIASHIVHDIGDKRDQNLTPTKLAAFYKAVGGNYDSFLVNNPHSAISYIWKVTGCQHSLQPSANDFEAPSIPALTHRGFSRWQSLQILLDPEEHVPFVQFAVKNWNLKHPQTGEAFPPDLPKDVFPTKTDNEVDRWHQSCADQLREDVDPKPEASSHGRSGPGAAETGHNPPKFAYVHVRDAAPRESGPSDHQRRAQPFAYNHVPPGKYANRRGSARSPDKDMADDAAKEQARRRSFSDYPSPTPDSPRQPYTRSHAEHSPNRASHGRRHSNPRHPSSDDSEADHLHRRGSRHQHHSPPPPPSIRRVPPPNSAPSAQPNVRAHRSEIRADDHRKRNVPSPRGLRNKLSETVSSILPNSLSSDRPRGSRQNSHEDISRLRRTREPVQSSRLGRSYSESESDSSLDDESSEDEATRRRRAREERDRVAHNRDRGRQYRDKEEERDNRRPPQHLPRPDMQRRTSSHADVDRRGGPPAWDAHERDRQRDERKKWDRRQQADRGPSPGSTGRRYPEAAY